MKILIEMDERKIADLAKVPVKVLGTEQNTLLDNLFTRDDIYDCASTTLEGDIAKAFQDRPKFRDFFADCVMERISKNFNAEYGINWDSIKDAIKDEVAAVERDMERGSVPPGLEKVQTLKAELSSDSFVREEQRKRLERLFHIYDIQKHGSVNQPRCVQMFAKVIIEYLNEAYQQYQKEIFPSHTANVIDNANMHAMKELLQHGVSSQDLVKIILEYSPAKKIADLRGYASQHIKDAMGIVLDAQREIAQGKGLEAGKEAAASL